MQINFGKHSGKTAEEVVVKHASYVSWVVSQTNPNAQMSALQKEFDRLITVLDSRPFVGKCSSTGCKNPVTNLTAYLNNDSDLYRWCDHCDPYSSGANAGKLTKVRTYADVMRHAQFSCGNTNGSYDRIVKALAKMKGLPARVSSATAIRFFA